MAITRQRIPSREPMIDRDTGLVHKPWLIWLRDRGDIVDSTPIRLGQVNLTNQNTSIPATVVPMVLTGGLYRVSVFAQRTTIGSTSSALGVIIWFRSNGVLLSVATPVNTDNTTLSVFGGSWMIRVDPNSAIEYETNYGSVAAGEMKYTLDVVVEQVQG